MYITVSAFLFTFQLDHNGTSDSSQISQQNRKVGRCGCLVYGAELFLFYVDFFYPYDQYPLDMSNDAPLFIQLDSCRYVHLS